MKRIISVLTIITITLILLPQALADLDDGLVAYWPFNGNANDESGNGNDGLVNGPTLCEDRHGRPDKAYFFDGVDDYINIGNNVKPPFPITVSTWVKPYDLQINGCVFRNDRWNDQSYRNGLAIMYKGGGESRSHVFEGFSACWNRRSETSYDPVASTGNWHHFVVVFHTHKDMRHFWNGIELDGYSECSGSRMTYSSSNGAIGHNISPTGGRYVKAAIDDIRVYNRALSAAEIDDLYKEGPCTLPIGHLDYCSDPDCGPCDKGEGDCDNDGECAGDLICPQVSGPDTCQEPGGECTLLEGHLDYCSDPDCGPCDKGEGDCDNDSECAGDLICPQVSGPDTCQEPGGECTLLEGHLDYCSDPDCGPCDKGEGDCDNDSECKSGLTCIQVTGTDVCCSHPLGHLDYCRDCGPCAAGQGDCDNDSECAGDLTCPQVPGTDTCQ
jgi:hypothetical protein